MDTLHRLLYTSSLSSTASPACIPHILRTSRVNNSRLGITSLLLFDGQRFCQYLEGLSVALYRLANRIGDDSRHVDFDIKEHGPFRGERRFPDWSVCYGLVSDTDGLSVFKQCTGESCFALLDALLPHAALEPQHG